MFPYWSKPVLCTSHMTIWQILLVVVTVLHFHELFFYFCAVVIPLYLYASHMT